MKLRPLLPSALLLLVIGLVACAPKDDELKCGPPDQYGAFMARLDTKDTVRVTIDRAFSSEEQERIEAALQVWNIYGRQELGRNVFTVANRSLVQAGQVPKAFEDCEFQGEPGSLAIVRQTDQAQWQALKLSSINPAATIRCFQSNRVLRQVVMLNMGKDDRTRDITQLEQLKSIVIHELGHAIGLDHSCLQGAGQSNYASCSGLSQNHPYRQAVMYPTLMINENRAHSSERKEELRSNDRERAACLLK